MTTTTQATTTNATTSHSRTQSVEEAACYYGAPDGLMLNNTMDSFSSSHPAPVWVDEKEVKKEAEQEEMMTTALLLNGALGDMVAVSTPARGCGGRLRARILIMISTCGGRMISTCGGRWTRTMSRR
jgi:hypothetical protein